MCSCDMRSFNGNSYSPDRLNCQILLLPLPIITRLTPQTMSELGQA